MTQSFKPLVNSLVSIETSQDMEAFLLGLFTPGELQEFTRRIKIVQMLKQGIAQHTIAKTLGVGVATVTRGAKELQKGRFTDL